MLFGATNPTHQWLKLSLDGGGVIANRWLDEVVELILRLMGRTNTYNGLATNYLDMGVFGSSVMLIYADSQKVFRTYTLPAGEYRLAKDGRGLVSYLGAQVSDVGCADGQPLWRERMLAERIRRRVTRSGAERFHESDIYHLIEPNNPPTLPEHFAFRECYWEYGSPQDEMLAYDGHYEKPFIAPRWELVGNNTYGVSPGMDALPDIIQLQHMTRRGAQGLDKQVHPPMVMDQSLRNQPSPLMPNGITYVPNAAQTVAKPLYTVQLPFQELQLKENDLREAINGYFYNDLFRAILNLTDGSKQQQRWRRQKPRPSCFWALLSTGLRTKRLAIWCCASWESSRARTSSLRLRLSKAAA